MKTYTYLPGILLALFLVACSKSNETPTDEGENPVSVDYAVLLHSGSALSEKFINSSTDGLTINNKESFFPGFAFPDVSYRTESTLSFFHKTGECQGVVLVYDFDDDSNTEIGVFDDLGICDLTVTAIAHTNTKVFVSYMIEGTGKDKTYFIRTIQSDSENMDFTDLEISQKPLDLVPTNNRLFTLTLDEEITDENGIQVIDVTTGTFIHDMNLGYDAGKIFEDPNGDIIISYSELHTTLNSNTLAVVYTQYGSGTEPNFVDSETVSFDSTGKMYYQMLTESDAETETIPAVYDFEANTTTLYFFENFLTDSQLNVEYNIDAATTLKYDEANDLILIGYKKDDSQNKGGIMRISPSPNFAFVDNIDLDGVPYAIFVK